MGSKGLLLALLLAAPAGAEELLRHPYWTEARPVVGSTAPVNGITTGETLEYDIYWGLLYVGKSFIRVDSEVAIASRTAWHIVSEAKSASVLNAVYKVDDRNESWMDTGDFSSHGYYRKLSEGHYFYNEWAVFDLPGRRFYGQKMNRKRETSSFEGPLDRPVSDYLSAVFRLRLMRIAPGEKLELDVNSKKNWRLTVTAGKREKISTPYGKRKCVLLEPKTGEESLFVSKAGRRMLIWITDDELKLPMMLKAEIFIGSVTAKLVRRTVTP
ncbi:MAG: DUF3108 domain-containing protein [Elusimicrobia bacterium]|nr:DUF3108 domain-containing protein [Elusimicrobiota bacterium]MDA8244718.1 DUF3108 domain-containing protein [Elusimicrobiota bacterium]